MVKSHKYIYDWHLAKQLFSQLAIWTSFFAILFLLSIFLDKVDTFLAQDTPAPSILRYLLIQTPFWLWKAAPLAFLGASLTVLDQANRTGELVALESLGISPARIYVPIFGTALALCLLGEFSFESKSPYFYRSARMFLKTQIEKKTLKHQDPVNNFVAKGSKGHFYVFGHYNPADNTFRDFWMEEWENEERKRQVFALSGYYDRKDHLWHLSRAAVRIYKPQEELITEESLKLALPDKPERLLPSVWRLDEMTRSELKTAADFNRKRGIVQRNLLAEYYHRFTWPLSFLVLAFSGVMVLGLFPKKMFQGKLLLFGITMVLGLLYWFLVNLSKTMASHGVLDERLSAWAPHAGIIVFVLLARFATARLTGKI